MYSSGANHYLFCVLVKNTYSTTKTKHFMKLISFPAQIWHAILHLVIPPLVEMTAWIRFGIAECMTSRSSEFNVHQFESNF